MARPVDALRIAQLDARQLDQELVSLVRNQIGRIFEYNQLSLLTKLDPEITALLKFVIWRFSVFATGASVGQQLLRLTYANARAKDKTNPWMSKKQKLLHGFILIIIPWLKERLNLTIDSLGLSTSKTKEKINKYLQWCEKSLKIAALINFALFLQSGCYSSLTERVLGIRSVHPQKQLIRQVSFDYLTREILWHGFSEFLFFLLPLVNFRRMKSILTYYLLPQPPPAQPSSPDSRTMAELTNCAICDLVPHNPHQIGCSHVFCYYCISSNFLADPRYVCPVCKKAVLNFTLISPVDITEESS
ncbi:peroxisome biogenesis factor 2-like [Octopus vulgaris]|uniref:Peroxisome biogenesis factor 2 n=1 Tax=Octopus vulgaris TaxID=6645 RepID=A0AA36FLH1_OCTVU|nr:peroxisome biogenesis factor 2-like [Octopus vulgaris]